MERIILRFELSNPSILKTVITGLSVIVDECAILFTSEEVLIRALSRDHTTFMTVELKKYLFDEYEADDGETVIVDVDELNKIMKRCKNTDLMECNVDEANLNILFKGDSERIFSIRLIDNDYESPRPPIIEHPCKLTVPTNVLSDTLGDLGIFTDIIQISADNDYLRFKGAGTNGEGFIKYLHGEHIQNYYRSDFSISKLLEIMKTKDFSESLTIGLGDNLPLELTFKLVTGDGKIEFLLAPRIDNES